MEHRTVVNAATRRLAAILQLAVNANDDKAIEGLATPIALLYLAETIEREGVGSEIEVAIGKVASELRDMTSTLSTDIVNAASSVESGLDGVANQIT